VFIALSWRFELVREAPIGALGDDPLRPMNSTLLRSRRRYNGDGGGYTGGRLSLYIARISDMAGIAVALAHCRLGSAAKRKAGYPEDPVSTQSGHRGGELERAGGVESGPPRDCAKIKNSETGAGRASQSRGCRYGFFGGVTLEMCMAICHEPASRTTVIA
jgi:NAD-dependent dihydropyrimidine dehydrogenase PreA subunit